MAVNRLSRVLVDSVLRPVLFAVLPPHCVLCGLAGAAGRDLCGACASDVIGNRPCCARCALPLQSPAPMCGECLRSQPPFVAAFVPFVYGHPIDLLITRLKFGAHLAAGRVLARLWLDAWRDRPGCLPQAIVPVPLHRARLRQRGYNQALELARPLSKTLGIALCDTALVRTRDTAAQSDLDAVARRRNLRGAFQITMDAVLPSHVALIDDVMTSGTTLRECAAVLKKGGVERVDVWAFARAPK